MNDLEGHWQSVRSAILATAVQFVFADLLYNFLNSMLTEQMARVTVMVISHLRLNSTQLDLTVVIVDDNAMTSLALWRHAVVHRPRVVWAAELSLVASAS